jgi:hypothetical protein
MLYKYVSYLIFAITNLIRYICFAENILWYGCLLSIVEGCIVAWLFNRGMTFFYNRRRHLHDNAYEINMERDIMNHFRGIITDGGIGYLYEDKLVFVPHKFNFSRKTIAIPFADIAKVSTYKIWGIINTGLRITLKSGKEERFVMNKSGDFYKNLILYDRKSTRSKIETS